MFYKTALFLIVAALIPLIPISPCFSETESIEQAFQRALKSIEKEKIKEQEELVAKLKSKLNIGIDEWLAEMKKTKESEVNQFIKQNWEKLANPKDSTYYDYYLKDFTYLIAKVDITTTNSLITPYKAFVVINEDLYVERYHPPSISFREKFLYTASRMINLSFVFQADKFSVTDTEFMDYSLNPGWPEEVKAKMITR